MIRRSIIHLGLPLALVLAGITAMVSWLLPTITATRMSIDTDRANLLALQQQETSLKTLTQEQDQVHTTQAALSKEIWQFAQEDNFFNALSTIAKQTGVTIPDPKIADVAPSTKYLTRAVTITITGSVTNAARAITAIQNIQPLISITDVVIQGSGTVTTTVTATTVWQ